MIPRRYQRGIAFSVVLAAAIYLVLILYSGGFTDLLQALERFPWWGVPVAIGLASINWFIRFLKWERYRTLLGVRISLRQSLLIYFAGFALSVTPGKMGEAYKSLLIKRIDGSPISRTAPIVIAERLTDLLGLVILMAGFGALTVWSGQRLSGAERGTDLGRWIGLLAVGTLLGCVALLVVLFSDSISDRLLRTVGRLPFVWRVRQKLEASRAASRTLLSVREVCIATVLSVFSWSGEALALFFIASRFSGDLPGLDDAPGAAVTLQLCFFAYSYGMIAGNLAIVLPAGVGLTEGLLGWLLDHAGGLSQASANSAALMLRACTLWAAVVLGLVAAGLFERWFGSVEESPESRSE